MQYLITTVILLTSFHAMAQETGKLNSKNLNEIAKAYEAVTKNIVMDATKEKGKDKDELKEAAPAANADTVKLIKLLLK